MALRFNPSHRQKMAGVLISAVLGVCSHAANAQTSGSINLYTTREPKLIQPLLDEFSKSTGVKVNVAFFKDGMAERVKAEGVNSPADVLMTVDIGNLLELVDKGLTQPVVSKELDESIPVDLRGAKGHWFALSLRDRVLYANKNLDIKSFQYEDLAKPEWKGKVCIRSGQHPYNLGLIAAMIAHNGEAETEQWLRGVKSNLARKATGGDRDVARDILGGICDIGIANAYYAGQMKSASDGSDARKWGDAISVVRPTFKKSGATFVNITGVSLAKSSPNQANAIKLMEFFASDKAQSMYAKVNHEYPVKPGVAIDPLMKSFGPLHPDMSVIPEIVKNRQLASKLVDRVGFDQ